MNENEANDTKINNIDYNDVSNFAHASTPKISGTTFKMGDRNVNLGNISYSYDMWSNSANSYLKTFEIELVDGRRTILRTSFNEITDLYETTDKDTEEKRVQFTLRGKNYEVKCSLSSFMRLLGEKYTEWAKTVMENMLENGE